MQLHLTQIAIRLHNWPIVIVGQASGYPNPVCSCVPSVKPFPLWDCGSESDLATTNENADRVKVIPPPSCTIILDTEQISETTVSLSAPEVKQRGFKRLTHDDAVHPIDKVDEYFVEVCKHGLNQVLEN